MPYYLWQGEVPPWFFSIAGFVEGFTGLLVDVFLSVRM